MQSTYKWYVQHWPVFSLTHNAYNQFTGRKIPATVPVVLDICMQCQRAVACQRSLLKAVDKLVPQVGAAGYKATPSYAIVQYLSKFLVSFLTFCLDMR